MHFTIAILLGAFCGVLLGVNGFNFTDDESTGIDGCRYVYMDVGSNIGIHVRFLFEPKNYPKSKFAGQIFDRFFMKNRDRKDICAFGFEPNPAHVDRLDHLSAHLKSKGHRAYFFHGGVSNETSTKTFYALPNDTEHNDWGFSALPRNGFTKKFTVNTIDISKFILNKVVKRKIPPPLHLEDPPPTVIMKMDIEGYEYVVLPMMLATKAICDVDVLTIEYHDNKIKVPEGTTAQMQEKLKLARENGCKVRVFDLDDESYLNDTEKGRADLLGNGLIV